jgi:tetratricopeptide (TPR) repeat protein
VRRYCYDRLTCKEKVHSQLIDYFAAVPPPEKVESIDDLAPVIEQYHHTVRAGRYDEAYSLLIDRLVPHPLHFQLGAYQTMIELEKEFFEDEEYEKCRLKEEFKQAWLYAALASSYAFSGQPRHAINSFQIAANLADKLGNKMNFAISLGAMASIAQLPIGDFDSAESNNRRRIEICRELNDEFEAAAGHAELGRLLAYKGEFKQSENELNAAQKEFEGRNTNYISVVRGYKSLRSIFMSNADEALENAIKARELVNIQKVERDIICAEWLLGASYLRKGNLTEAERHLSEALTRDRKINLVEYEPDILLEFAKLRFK